MSDLILFDNDIVLKAATYRMGETLLGKLSDVGRPATLVTARFVLMSRLQRGSTIVDADGARLALERFLRESEPLEPDDDEIELASDLTEAAQVSLVDLDSGEAILLAILVNRSGQLLMTGDKRAIAAAEVVVDRVNHLREVEGRLACLEQVFLALLRHVATADVRERVCAEPNADRTLSICFSCASASVDEASVLEGLRSYAASVRGLAPRCLAAGELPILGA
jgi:hypothetical protein